MERIEVAGAASQRQLWLDVPRPIQARPPRVTGNMPEKHERDLPAPVATQMEMRMETKRVIEQPAAPYAYPAPAPPAARSFANWLLEQAKRPGTLGELAKAARLDRAFPKTGSADAVRARFNAVGADGDAFEALDDAEREFDRNDA